MLVQRRSSRISRVITSQMIWRMRRILQRKRSMTSCSRSSSLPLSQPFLPEGLFPPAALSPFGSPCFIASDLIPISSALRSDLSPQDIFKANHVLQKVLELHSGFRDHDIPHLLQAVINILTDPHKPFYVRLPSRPFPFSLVRLFFLFSPALFLFGYRRSRALG